MTKKSAKQLDREIAQVLNGRTSRVQKTSRSGLAQRAHARITNPSELEIYSKAKLERTPTISEGHSEDLKIERKVKGVPTRWWLSRMTVEDGARHAVDIEQLRDGRWELVHSYGTPDRGAHAQKKKISSREAKQLLLSDDIDLSKRDYFDLSPSEVERVLEVAKLVGYRKSKNAPGSTGRMFVQYLRRLK